MAKLFRIKRGGKLIGSWRIMLKGREVNLRTQDAGEARKRAALAAKGLPFLSDEGAAANVAAAFDVVAEAAAEVSPAVSVPPPAEVPPVPPAVPPVEVVTPELISAPSASWADAAAGAAAGDTAGAAGTAEPPPASVNLGGFDLDGLMETAANLIVELQLRGQAYAIARYGNRIAGDVALDDPLRKLAIEGWKQQLKIWVPPDLPLPPWAVGLAMTGLCGASQYAKSQPIPKESAASA